MTSEAGRALAAARTVKHRTCALPGCEAEFETVGRRRYCTPAHQQYAWFLAHRSKGKFRRGERIRQQQEGQRDG